MVKKTYILAGIIALSLIGFVPEAFSSPFTLNLTFDSGYTSSQQATFNQAANYWSNTLDYQGTVGISSLDISVGYLTSDGAGGVLGGGGWTTGYWYNSFAYASNGVMNYDSADLATMSSTSLLEVCLHEIAHVIGFGTLWDYNGVYTDDSYEYTGANAVAAYQQEFNQPGATYVPVENDGGSGTANGHWEEDFFGIDALMTGWTNLDDTYHITQTTLASFVDIGYDVNETTAVPEPAGFLLLAVGCVGLAAARKYL